MPSDYQLFVKKYMQTHKGEAPAKDLMKDCAKAWRARGPSKVKGKGLVGDARRYIERAYNDNKQDVEDLYNDVKNRMSGGALVPSAYHSYERSVFGGGMKQKHKKTVKGGDFFSDFGDSLTHGLNAGIQTGLSLAPLMLL